MKMYSHNQESWLGFYILIENLKSQMLNTHHPGLIIKALVTKVNKNCQSIYISFSITKKKCSLCGYLQVTDKREPHYYLTKYAVTNIANTEGKILSS